MLIPYTQWKSWSTPTLTRYLRKLLQILRSFRDSSLDNFELREEIHDIILELKLRQMMEEEGTVI